VTALEISERIGRRVARMELLEWARLQPSVIHTERLLRFIRETEAADLSPEKGTA
jgi:hypothetical protein